MNLPLPDNMAGHWLPKLLSLVIAAALVLLAMQCRCASRPKRGRKAGQASAETVSLADDLKRLDSFKAGYMSNLFLPGAFKHGITYVGSPTQRRTIGLSKLSDTLLPDQRQHFEENVRRERLAGGHRADLIEAVAEGVIFNSLDKIAEERIGRLVALRPRLSKEQRLRQLTTVFCFLGCGYDFKFDFNDATYQCCTEVLYRSLNGLGPVRFGLVSRMGRPTLSADDVCRCALAPEPLAFDVVFLATQAPKKPSGHATILRGRKGLDALRPLLGENSG